MRRRIINCWLIHAVLVLTVASIMVIGCGQSTSTPVVSSVRTSIPKDWGSYNNGSLGISFRYPDTYTLLLDDPINSGIQLKSNTTILMMSANPMSLGSIETLAGELQSTGFRETDRVSIRKDSWTGLRLQGTITSGDVHSREVVYMLETPSGSLFTILAITTKTSTDLAEVDMIWDSLVLRYDTFTVPDDLLRKTPKATLQPEGQGYSLHYPQTWQAIVMSTGLVFVQDPENPDTFVMSITKRQSLENIVDKAIEHALDSLGVFDDVVLGSQHEVMLSGAQFATILIGTARFTDGSPAVFKTLLVLTSNCTYKVEIIADSVEWTSLSSIFDYILNSFTIDTP